MKTNSVVKHVESLSLAAITYKGRMEAIGAVYDRIVQWAAPKGLINKHTKMVTIYHDSPKTTDPSALRISACIVVNKPMTVEGEITQRTLESTKCLVSSLEISPTQFQQAWEASFAWMLKHGYKKSTIAPFAIYYNNAQEHPENKFIVDLCIPIL
jgi:AraC family transcriptional regulator